MKLYVQRLPQILAKKKLLATHTAIAECIKEVTDSYEFLDTLQVINTNFSLSGKMIH